MAEAIWVSQSKMAELGDAKFLELVHKTLRDPVEPGGYGYGRDEADPRVGRIRYRDAKLPNYPMGKLCVPNDEGSEDFMISRYDWPKKSEEPGIVIAKGIQGADEDGD